MLTKYDRALVRRAVAPSGIPYDFQSFMPTIGEIDRWLAEKQMHLERIEKYQSLPLPVYNYDAPASFEPNLFVPDDNSDYQYAETFATYALPKYFRRENRKCLYDGQVRAGMWVPDSWWWVRKSKTYQQWVDSLIKNPGLRQWDYAEVKSRRPYTEAEKAAFLESAKQAGRDIAGMKLSAEAQALLREQDERRGS